MRIKHIKQFAKEFKKEFNLLATEADLIDDFVNFLKQENRTRKCGTQNGSPQMPILPDFN